MLMTPSQSKVAKEVIEVLVEFLPYGPVGKKLLKLPVTYGLERMAQRGTTKTVESVAREIAGILEAIPVHLLDNAGSAASAASDVLAIVKASKLSPDVLVECHLDAQEVLAYLELHAAAIMHGASAER